MAILDKYKTRTTGVLDKYKTTTETPLPFAGKSRTQLIAAPEPTFFGKAKGAIRDYFDPPEKQIAEAMDIYTAAKHTETPFRKAVQEIQKPAMKSIVESYTSGQANVDRGLIGAKILKGDDPAKHAKKLSEIETIQQTVGQAPKELKRLRKGPGVDLPITRGARAVTESAANMLPFMKASFTERLKFGVPAGTGAAGAALFAGQAIPLPEEIATVPLAFGKGFSVGAKIGTIKKTAEIEAGNTYLDMVKDGVDRKRARPIAIIVGLVNGLIEESIQSKLLKGLTLGKKLKAIMDNPTAKKTFYTVLNSVAKDYGEEIFQEIQQELVTITGESIGKKELPDIEEVGERLREVGVESAKGLALLQAPGAAAQVRGGLKVPKGVTEAAARQEAAFKGEAAEIGKKPVPKFKNTEEAIAFGKEATPEQVEKLKQRRLEIEQKHDVILKKEDLTDAELQEGMNLAVEGQLYREAVEASEVKLTEKGYKGAEVTKKAEKPVPSVPEESRMTQTEEAELDKNMKVFREKGEWFDSFSLEKEYGRVVGIIKEEAFDYKNDKSFKGKMISISGIRADKIGLGQGKQLLQDLIDYARSNNIPYIGSISANEYAKKMFSFFEKSGDLSPMAEGKQGDTIAWKIQEGMLGKTKQQLADIWNEANETAPQEAVEPLTEQAKQYKSEPKLGEKIYKTVENQEYYSTDKGFSWKPVVKESVNVTGKRLGKTKGKYGTFYNIMPDLETRYPEYEGKLEEKQLSLDNVLKVENVTDETYPVKDLFYRWFSVEDLQNEMNNSGLESDEAMDKMVAEEAVRRGYDGIQFGEQEIVDLTDSDIWNKAQEMPAPSKFTGKAKVPVAEAPAIPEKPEIKKFTGKANALGKPVAPSKVKTIVRKFTGQSIKEEPTIKERPALKIKIKAEEKAAKEGLKEGIFIGKAKQKGIQDVLLTKAERRAELKLLKADILARHKNKTTRALLINKAEYELSREIRKGELALLKESIKQKYKHEKVLEVATKKSARQAALETNKQVRELLKTIEKAKKLPIKAMHFQEKAAIEKLKEELKSIRTKKGLVSLVENLKKVRSLWTRLEALKEEGKNKYLQIKETKNASFNLKKEILLDTLKYSKKEGKPLTKARIKAQKKGSKIRLGRASTLRPSRILDAIDGGQNFRGPFHRYFYDNPNRAVDEELKMVSIRRDTLLSKIKELKLKTKDFTKSRIIDGETLTVDEMISIYTAQFNETKKKAIIIGMGFEDSLQEKIINQMTDAEKKVGDLIIADYGENWDRLRKSFIEYTDGKQDLGKEPGYTPIRRLFEGYNTPAEELAAELVERANIKTAYANRDFTKERTMKGKKQLPIRLGEFGLWLEQIQKQEHFISHGNMVKQLQSMLGDPDIYNAIISDKRFGKEYYEAIQHYLNRVANNSIYKASEQIEKAWAGVRRNVAIAYLSYNFVTMAKQFPSIALGLIEAGPIDILSGMAELTRSYNKTTEFIHSLSPQMKNRCIERELEEFKNYQAESYNKIIKIVGQTGMEGIFIIDKFVVSAVWLSVYNKNIRQRCGQQESADLATKAVLRTQPAAHAKDIADMYATNEGLNWLTQFSNQINNIYNMATYDIPMKFKTGQYSDALRGIIGIALSQLLITIISSGRLPDDDEWDEVGIQALINLIPIIGPIIVSAMNGFYNSSLPALAPIANLAKAGTYLYKDKFKKAGKNLLESIALLKGVPLSQPKRTFSGAVDLYEGETEDWRRLVWSEWSLTKGIGRGKKKEDKKFQSKSYLKKFTGKAAKKKLPARSNPLQKYMSKNK